MRYFINEKNGCKYKTTDKAYIEFFLREYKEISKEEFDQIQGVF